MNCINCSSYIPSENSSDDKMGSITMPMDESYIFLPNRFGEASLLNPEKRVSFDEQSSHSLHIYNEKNSNLAESMMNITHTDVNKNISLATKLASYSSGQPVHSVACKGCLSNVIRTIESEISQTREEKRGFTNLLSSLTEWRATMNSSLKNDELKEQLLVYERELSTLKNSFKMMESESRLIHKELVSLRKVECSNHVEEWSLWKEINELQRDYEEFQNRRDEMIVNSMSTDDYIQKTNRNAAFNEAFHIWHQGPFGTINGFRLGRLQMRHVEWNEINAAWGEAALLLRCISEILQIKFTDYLVVPLGSFSIIRRLHGPEVNYHLYGSDQENYIESGFNLGMCAWLSCLAELGEHAVNIDSSIRLPYTIKDDLIGGHSIRFLRYPDKWTKALKFALTNLKWLSAWCGKRLH